MNTIFLHKLSIPWSPARLQVQAGRTALFVVASGRTGLRMEWESQAWGWVKPAPPKVGLRDGVQEGSVGVLRDCLACKTDEVGRSLAEGRADLTWTQGPEHREG